MAVRFLLASTLIVMGVPGGTMTAVIALQELLDQPFVPWQAHDHGPFPLIWLASPPLQRAVGADVRIFQLSDPQVQLIGMGVGVGVGVGVETESSSAETIAQFRSPSSPVAQNPRSVLAPDASVPFQVSGITVTVFPDLVIFPDQRLRADFVSRVNFQFLIAPDRVFFIVIVRQNPVFQSLTVALRLIPRFVMFTACGLVATGGLTGGGVDPDGLPSVTAPGRPTPSAQYQKSIAALPAMFEFQSAGATTYPLAVFVNAPFQKLVMFAPERGSVRVDQVAGAASVFLIEILLQKPDPQSPFMVAVGCNPAEKPVIGRSTQQSVIATTDLMFMCDK